MWEFIELFFTIAVVLAVVAGVAAYLSGKWIDYADGHSESRLTDRLNDAIERELFDI